MVQRVAYQIRVAANLIDPWIQWFDDLKITSLPGGESVLTTLPIDQGTLHGILAAIRDYNVRLIAVTQIDVVSSQGEEEWSAEPYNG